MTLCAPVPSVAATNDCGWKRLFQVLVVLMPAKLEAQGWVLEQLLAGEAQPALAG